MHKMILLLAVILITVPVTVLAESGPSNDILQQIPRANTNPNDTSVTSEAQEIHIMADNTAHIHTLVSHQPAATVHPIHHKHHAKKKHHPRHHKHHPVITSQ